MPAQKSAHDMPPGIGVEAQFFSWHSQYIWHAGELAVVEPPAAPALEPPAVAAPPAPAELDAPPAPPAESLDPQPSAVAHNETQVTTNSDRM